MPVIGWIRFNLESRQEQSDDEDYRDTTIVLIVIPACLQQAGESRNDNRGNRRIISDTNDDEVTLRKASKLLNIHEIFSQKKPGPLKNFHQNN